MKAFKAFKSQWKAFRLFWSEIEKCLSVLMFLWYVLVETQSQPNCNESLLGKVFVYHFNHLNKCVLSGVFTILSFIGGEASKARLEFWGNTRDDASHHKPGVKAVKALKPLKAQTLRQRAVFSPHSYCSTTEYKMSSVLSLYRWLLVPYSGHWLKLDIKWPSFKTKLLSVCPLIASFIHKNKCFVNCFMNCFINYFCPQIISTKHWFAFQLICL